VHFISLRQVSDADTLRRCSGRRGRCCTRGPPAAAAAAAAVAAAAVAVAAVYSQFGD